MSDLSASRIRREPALIVAVGCGSAAIADTRRLLDTLVAHPAPAIVSISGVSTRSLLSEGRSAPDEVSPAGSTLAGAPVWVVPESRHARVDEGFAYLDGERAPHQAGHARLLFSVREHFRSRAVIVRVGDQAGADAGGFDLLRQRGAAIIGAADAVDALTPSTGSLATAAHVTSILAPAGLRGG